MARNRALGSPYQTEFRSHNFTTHFGADEYLITAVPVVVTLDPYAVNNDQVVIQDITDAAGSNPIVINVSPGQTILNGYGESISVATNGGSVKLTMTEEGWVPQFSGTASGAGTTGATGPTGPTGPSGGQGSTGATGVGVSGTVATVTSGETYNLLATDVLIRFDTSGGTAAIADMIAPSFIGQRVAFYWWNWSVAQVPPVINADAGHSMQPFTGQATAGAAGLVTTTSIITPGTTFTLEWDGTEWISV